jgi:hypothetical protein
MAVCDREIQTVNYADPAPADTEASLQGTSSAWIDWAKEQIRELSELEEDWDEDGAQRMNPSVKSAGEAVLKTILDHVPTVPAPYIALEPNGCLLFEWRSGEKSIDIEVMSRYEVQYLYRDRSASPPACEPGVLFYPRLPGSLLQQLAGFSKE